MKAALLREPLHVRQLPFAHPLLDECGVRFVGAAADHDGVVTGQVAALERVRAEQLHRHAHRRQRLGHAVGRAAHIPHPRELR